jgi:hypothetical protein
MYPKEEKGLGFVVPGTMMENSDAHFGTHGNEWVENFEFEEDSEGNKESEKSAVETTPSTSSKKKKKKKRRGTACAADGVKPVVNEAVAENESENQENDHGGGDSCQDGLSSVEGKGSIYFWGSWGKMYGWPVL